MGARLIDGAAPLVVVLVAYGVGLGVFFASMHPGTSHCVINQYGHRTCTYDGYVEPVGIIVLTLSLGLASVFGLAYSLWNFGYRQGKTGSSIGKSMLKFKVVSEVTGQPIGFLMSFVRELAHIVDGAVCYIGYLFPLWDPKRQTLADKIMSTVCLPINQPGPGEQSGAIEKPGI